MKTESFLFCVFGTDCGKPSATNHPNNQPWKGVIINIIPKRVFPIINRNWEAIFWLGVYHQLTFLMHTSICIQVTSVTVTCATATSALSRLLWLDARIRKFRLLGSWGRGEISRHVDSIHKHGNTAPSKKRDITNLQYATCFQWISSVNKAWWFSTWPVYVSHRPCWGPTKSSYFGSQDSYFSCSLGPMAGT